MESLGKLFICCYLVCISIIIGGFTLMLFWGWFILPVFTTLPDLSFIQSIGVATFLSIFHRYKRDKEEKDFTEMITDWLSSFVYRSFLLGFGGIIYLFIR